MSHQLYIPKPMTLRFDPHGDLARPWEVVGDLKFANSIWALEVKSGSRTDLASVPYRRLWLGAWFATWSACWLGGPWIGLAIGLPLALAAAWLCTPYGLEQLAAVFHDEVYAQQPNGCTRFDADAAYRSLLLRSGVSLPKAFAHYYGVRVFGRAAWMAHVRRNEEAEKAKESRCSHDA